jgi:hypothetical protein
MGNETLALTTMYVAGICGFLGLIVPRVVLRFSRTAAAVTAGVLAAVGTIALWISNANMPGKYDILVDLVVLLPLLLAVWVACGRLSISAIRRSTCRPTSDVGPTSIGVGAAGPPIQVQEARRREDGPATMGNASR